MAMIRPKSQNFKIGHDCILSIGNFILMINQILLFQLPDKWPTTKKCAPYFRGNMEFPIYLETIVFRGQKSIWNDISLSPAINIARDDLLLHNKFSAVILFNSLWNLFLKVKNWQMVNIFNKVFKIFNLKLFEGSSKFQKKEKKYLNFGTRAKIMNFGPKKSCFHRNFEIWKMAFLDFSKKMYPKVSIF
jgi:hypothetical protein